jgi:hypothetical protein
MQMRTVRYGTCWWIAKFAQALFTQTLEDQNLEQQLSTYRQVAIGEMAPDAVTVGIEKDAAGAIKSAVWWEAKGDVDADEAEYGNVGEALAAAEAARTLHGFSEVVVALQDGLTWQAEWGDLKPDPLNREPIGDVTQTDLSDDEAFELAAHIEAERDA